MVDRDSLKAMIGVIWTVVIEVDSWSAMIAATGSTIDASPNGITTSTGSTIDTACSGTACGSGRTVLIIILTTIAGGCANEPSPLAAHIGGAVTTTVSATTRRRPAQEEAPLYVELFLRTKVAATA
jgi:hypothetical protein